MKTGPVRILLVEDNAGDIRLTREAFAEAEIDFELSVARDGVEAMELLRSSGKVGECRRPDLILLDLNMPRKDGREVLQELKSDADLMSIPVVVLSVSVAASDIQHSYGHYANCYVEKPLELRSFLAVARGVDEFWLTSLRGLRKGQG
jgi:two-component system, chemotaxis family, response regulator Rcp1